MCIYGTVPSCLGYGTPSWAVGNGAADHLAARVDNTVSNRLCDVSTSPYF